ncbi:MAG TPA: M20/M25/M40 family metallo-hydrolase [Allosphingosinicella sp.]
MKRNGILAALVLLLIVAMAFKGALVQAPPLRSAPAPGSFDTARAMARLQRVLGDQRPHPVDTAAGDAVRARLVAELTALGLRPVVTDSFACTGSATVRSVSCARVRNVRATIGPAAGRHVLMASHYDSTAAGPGAADDGLGVAVMLETAALLKDRRLARPVTFLFDEGEEAGLLGARAFLDGDPLAARVGWVVNVEARGVTGPAIMFETSRPNRPAVALYARTAERPVANSLTADFYRLIPNSTDVSVFAARPWTMLNFAIIGNETRYHSPGDTLAALDRRSVQHMGDQAFAATAALAAGETPTETGTSVYADTLGLTLVQAPLWVGLAGLAALLAGALVLAWRRRRGLSRAAAAVAAALVASAALSFAAQVLVALLRPGVFWRAHPEIIATAIDVTAISVSGLLLLWLARNAERTRLRAAFWLLFLLLGAGIAAVAPGASIFFLAPPLTAFAGMVAGRPFPGAERIGAILAWAVLFLSWAPLLHLSQVLLDFGAAWMFGAVAALIVLPVLIELKPALSGGRAAIGLLTAGILAWTAVALAPAYSEDRKQGFRIEYAWDAAAAKGQWLVAHDGGPLPKPFDALRDDAEVAWSLAKRRAAPAPAVPLPAPALDVLEASNVPGGRDITARLRTNGAEWVLLRWSAEAGLREAGTAGASARFGKGTKDEPYFLRCSGRSCDGLTLRLRVGAGPSEVTLSAFRSGLPREGEALLRARPATAAAQYGPDASIAWRKLRL